MGQPSSRTERGLATANSSPTYTVGFKPTVAGQLLYTAAIAATNPDPNYPNNVAVVCCRTVTR